jgi:hypothetical protein
MESRVRSATEGQPEIIRLAALTPRSLAEQLDEHGVVRLRGAVSAEWLEAMQRTVRDSIDSHDGAGDLYIVRPDLERDSPAHRLMSDESLRRLLSDTAAQRVKDRGAELKYECNIPVRNGASPKMQANRFHYDPCVLTLIVPIFIPPAVPGTGGELVAFGNRRPFRRFVGTHLLETVLTQNPLYRRRLAKTAEAALPNYIVALQPGDAYMFWGYRQLHGNLACAPGLLRATLVVSLGEVHGHSWALKVAWQLSRSRRRVGRLRHVASTRSASTAESLQQFARLKDPTPSGHGV